MTRAFFIVQESTPRAEEFAAKQVEAGIWNERWPRLLIDCQMVQGKYAEATKTYEDAIRRYPTSLTLRMQGLQAFRDGIATSAGD